MPEVPSKPTVELASATSAAFENPKEKPAKKEEPDPVVTLTFKGQKVYS